MAILSEAGQVRSRRRSPVLLEARDVAISYVSQGRTLVAVRDFNLTVASGQFVALVGPSGCGKSSFLMAVDGLLPVSRGSINVAGQPVRGPAADRAMVFQDPSLLPWRTVEENIEFGLVYGPSGRKPEGRDKDARRRQVRGLIQLVGLEGFEKAYPGQLSGGMQQRVNLARALAVNPTLLLLDEPFAALDAQRRELMQDEVTGIWEREAMTALLVTHQIDEAIYMGDRVVVMTSRPGRSRAEFPVEFDRPRQPEMRDDPAFAALAREVGRLVREEIQRDRKSSVAREE